MVFHPAWRVAPSYDLHDHSGGFIHIFSRRLHHLSCAGRRKIVGIHRLDCRRLLPDTGFACSACLCDVASCDCDACSGLSSPMGSTQAHRALDGPYLVVRLGHRRACLFNALQMVPPGNVMPANPARDRLARRGGLKSAAGGDLEIAPS